MKRMMAMRGISFVSDTVESNGKTIRENNLQRPHNIPIGTLVEVYGDGGVEDYAGIRAFVVDYQRDCDGEPLYGLGLDKEITEAIRSGDSFAAQASKLQIEGGFSESCLRIVRIDREGWPQVPPIGTYVVADHPITPLNPHLIFCVKYIESSAGRVLVRGEKTCWFGVGMLRQPTQAECENLENYNPDEL